MENHGVCGVVRDDRLREVASLHGRRQAGLGPGEARKQLAAGVPKGLAGGLEDALERE